MAVQTDIKALFEAGAHFGHKTSRWHPKMAPYIHSKRQDSHIIDLAKTVEALNVALPIISKTVASGKQVLFVGTKKQAKDITRQAAEAVGQPYVTNRWVGGMLTNVTTTTAQIKKLKDLERRMASGDLEKRYNKLEVQRYQEEIDSLDILADNNALREAKTLGVPVIGIVDTNANPDLVDYPIPANDDAIKSLQLMLDYFSAAVNEGKATKEEN